MQHTAGVSVPVHCPKCGLQFTSRIFDFQHSTNVTITSSTETCPRCGANANIQDGTYDFVGKVLTAIRSPGISRDDILAFRQIAEDRKNNKINSKSAADQVAEINSTLSTLWKWMNENGAAIAAVLGIIAILVAIWAKEASDAGSDQAHQDAQQLMQMQQQIYEALKEQGVSVVPPAAQLAPKLPKQQPHQTQMQGQAGSGNRKERRAAAAKARHHSSS